MAENTRNTICIDLHKASDNTSIEKKPDEEKSTMNQEITQEATEDSDEGIESEDSKINAMDDEFLARAIECVKANMSNEASGKGDFADAMRISQSLLYKKIKAITDMSVVEFIRSIRLNHAMALLGSGRYNVTEVSEMCGFSSSAYFSRVFKDSFGKNPSDLLP